MSELENLIAAKDKAMNDLKDAISRALTDFEGKGLTVEQRDGKVYVSMENKLLFKSGSWAVGAEGRRAVEQLGTVLADNPEINVLIEGHTDNVPYKGNAQLSGNWDLSTKRATAIVKILQENAQIKTENLTAAKESAKYRTPDTVQPPFDHDNPNHTTPVHHQRSNEGSLPSPHQQAPSFVQMQ